MHYLRPVSSAGLESVPTIVVFARAPAVESKPLALGRLAQARWHRQLLDRTLELTGRSGAPVLLVSDVPGADLPQRGESFEERLLNAVADVAALGVKRICLIGSDTPELDERLLERALNTPAGAFCIGPSKDGGFYLLVMDTAEVEVLRGLPWRASGLFKALLKRTPGAVLLRPLSDVDDWRSRTKVQRLIAPVDLGNTHPPTRTPWLEPLIKLEPDCFREISPRGPPASS